MTGRPVPRLPESEYRWMSRLLQGGLLLSLGILAVAVLAYAATHPGLTVGGALAANPILAYLGVSALAAGLARGDLSAYLTLGLIVLVATPLLRVATGFYFFRQSGERAMQGITITVLVLLLFGLLFLGPLIR